MTPEGWRKAAISSFGEVVAGKAKNTTGNGNERPYLRVANVFDGRIDIRDVFAMPFSDAEFARYKLEPGDVLLNEGQSLELVGRCAMYRGEYPGPCGIQNALIRFRAGPQIVSEFAEQLFRWCQRSGVFAEIATQTTSIAHLGVKRLAELELAIPSLAEQRQIAAILSSVDNAIESTQAVIDQLGVVKNAMMAELLTRGLPGRHTRFKMTEIGELPEEWEVVRAGDVCSVITKGATPASQTRDFGEVPFLKVYNIDPKGFVDFSYQPTFIPHAVHATEMKRSRVGPGDVLMNIVGPPLGKVAVVPDHFGPANINQAIAVFRATGVEAQFLEACLRAESLFSWALARAKRTSTQLNLTLELCRDYPLPLPPAEERGDILAMFAAIDERFSAEEAYIRQLRTTKTALMSVLLTGEVRVKPDRETA